MTKGADLNPLDTRRPHPARAVSTERPDAATTKATRRRRLVLGTAAGGAILGVTGVILAVLVNGKTGETVARDPVPNTYGSAGLPPWATPSSPLPGAIAARLNVSAMGTVSDHFHSHLDIIANGKPVSVAADLGVDPVTGFMSPLHTHDLSGVIHVEAAARGGRYTLGQLFNLWDVKLDATHVGGLTARDGRQLLAYVDGIAQPGNPAAIVLTEHRQISLVFGLPNKSVPVPTTYNFGADS